VTGGDRGSATVHAVWVGAALCVVSVIITQVAVAVRFHHQAAAAADLAALAGSRAASAGEDGCARARDVARRNEARLVSCRMDLDVATVTARRDTDRWWGRVWTFEVDARAAPDSYVPAS
jgi:secretion/DNA translocation related TadE-like protein